MGAGWGWCFNKTCSWDFSVIILTYWNLLTVLHIESKAARRNEKWGQMCISHRNAPAPALYLSSLEKGRQQTHWSVLYIPPRSRREMGEVFLSMPQWGKGGEGYQGIYRKKSGWIDSNCEKREGEKEHQERKGWINNRGHASPVQDIDSLFTAKVILINLRQ